MRDLRPVAWSKGMFLTPQHFQAQDRYFEEQLQFRLTNSLFANYGLTALEIDGESLANNQFRVVKASGIMPDGLPFSIPQTDTPPPGRPVDFPPTQESLDVYLGIPDRQPEARNFAPNGDTGSVVRFVAGNADVADEYDSGERKTIQFGVKNFRVLFEDQSRDGFKTLRIARVLRKSGALTLDPEFIPPLLQVAGNERLMAILKRLVEVLAAKSGGLNLGRRQRGANLAEFSNTETAAFWLLHTVNTALAELNHVYDVRRGHPEPIYVTLLRLAGALSTFALDARIREFPRYEHDNLQICFSALDAKIRELLETVIPSNCISVPLRLVDTGTWNGKIAEDSHLRNSQFYLAVNARLAPDDLIRKVPQLVKIAPPDEMKVLVTNALPGLPLRYDQHPPSTINFRRDNQYFSISQVGRFWDKIRQTRSIALYAPSEITEIKVELLIVLES